MAEDDAREPGTVSHVHKRLRLAILEGRLVEDASFSQVKLASELGVSRTPLREALRMLEREGLIDTARNRQARVRPLTVADLDDLYAVRVMVEALAARVSVPRLTTEDLDAMASHLDEMRVRSDTLEPHLWDLPHAEFHRLLIGRAGQRLDRIAAVGRDHAKRYRVKFLTQHVATTGTMAHHVELMEACERRDGATASMLLARHLASTALGLVSELAPGHDPVMVRSALALVAPRLDDRTRR